MKQLLPASHTTTGLWRLCRRRTVQRLGAWLTLLSFLPLATGACNYYRTKTQPATPPELSRLAENKLFIVHQGDQIWQLLHPHLDGQTLSGTRQLPTAQALRYLMPNPQGGTFRYRHQDHQTVLNLVHLYLAPDALISPEGTAVQLPVASIQRLDIVEADTGATVLSHVFSGIGIAAGVIVLIGIIAILTKSSCPFVYAHNGHGYQFVGEIYGGAIFKPAERDDYLPLPAIVPSGETGGYAVKISNELKERQYTNVAELWVADHPAGCRVLLDSAGRPHTLRQPQAPLQAISGGGIDRTAQLRATDHDAVLFNDPTPSAAPNQLTLRFARPPGAQSGKLVLHAQNSLWLDFLYGKFIEQFGSYYNTWAARQHDLPAATNARWAQQQYVPLQVYCRPAGGSWQRAGAVPTVGPLASRDLVVPLHFGPGRGPVEVRLETGFMFWEVDYAALDCTPDEAVQLEKCAPRQATTEQGADVRAALRAADGQYLAQLQPGTEVRLSYQPRRPAPPAGSQRTVFLRTRGYYEHVRDFRGLPNLPALYSFYRPGRFSEFSQQTYQYYAPAEPVFAAAHP